MRPSTLYRPLAVMFALLLAFGATLGLPPARAYADDDDDNRERLVFAADFDDAPAGPLTLGTALAVDTGSVLPQVSPVAITNNALQVSGGTGSALLRFVNYPDGLPGVSNSRRHDLRVKASFTATDNTSLGAAFGLELADGNFFELFTFGADGQFRRAGRSLGVAYPVDGPITLDASFQLNRGTVVIRLSSSLGRLELRDVRVPDAFNPRTINQLRFKATTDQSFGLGAYTIDRVEVKVKKDDDDDDDEPPAVIVINPPSSTVEIINSIVFININITIVNIGGDGRGNFLYIDLDDLLELSDLSFLEGIGYIKEVRGRTVIIGLGQNNVVRHDGKLTLKIKFKSKGDGRSELKSKVIFRYQHSGGELTPIIYNVVIPAVVLVPVVVGTPVVSPTGTLSITGVLVRLPVERIDVRFRTRWQRGGLRLYGLPLGEPLTLANGIVVQYFERARFEYHPGGVVLLGLLGVELGYTQAPLPPPTSTNTLSATLYFLPTGHYVAPVFIDYWRAQGGLPVFGYPIGAPIRIGGLLVQYFERARFEYHPQNERAYQVLLGFLGEEALMRRGDDDNDD